MRYNRECSFDFGKPLMERLVTGEVVLSLGVRFSRSPDIARMASGAGYDLLWIDLEHSSMSIDMACQIAATAHDLGLGAWVRVPEKEYGVIGRLLDSGATGIFSPKIETAEEAQRLADACRFPPDGLRSMIARGPQNGFARLPGGEFHRSANRDVVVQALIESPRGIKNAEAIAQIAGIDIVSVGANDLAAEIGCSGQMRDPRMAEAFAAVASAAKRNGKPSIVGGVADDEVLRDLICMGFARFFFAGVDTDIMADGMVDRVDDWRRRSV